MTIPIPQPAVEPDLVFVNEGSVVLIRAQSFFGESWLEENLDMTSAMRFGDFIAADWRCADAILHGAVEHGLRTSWR